MDQSEMRAHLEGTLPMSVVSVLSLILPSKQKRTMARKEELIISSQHHASASPGTMY